MNLYALVFGESVLNDAVSFIDISIVHVEYIFCLKDEKCLLGEIIFSYVTQSEDGDFLVQVSQLALVKYHFKYDCRFSIITTSHSFVGQCRW